MRGTNLERQEIVVPQLSLVWSLGRMRRDPRRVCKALVICEHRELILSASPSTSGTARQTENGSRLKT